MPPSVARRYGRCLTKVMRFLLAIVLGSSALAIGCGASPNHVHRHVRVPVNGVVVVPADQLDGNCHCDDDDDDELEPAPLPKKPVAYIKLDEWQPSSQVAEVEATIPARGPADPTYTQYPALTMHREIVATTFLGRWRYRR